MPAEPKPTEAELAQVLKFQPVKLVNKEGDEITVDDNLAVREFWKARGYAEPKKGKKDDETQVAPVVSEDGEKTKGKGK